jgi:hypothetical protein
MFSAFFHIGPSRGFEFACCFAAFLHVVSACRGVLLL